MSDSEDSFDFDSSFPPTSPLQAVMRPTQYVRDLIWNKFLKFKTRYPHKDIFKHPEVTEDPLKAFVMWYATQSREISPTTLAHYVWPLRQECIVRTGQVIDRDLTDRVRACLDLQLVRDPNSDIPDKPLATLTIQFNYLKGARGSGKFLKLTLKEDRELPSAVRNGGESRGKRRKPTRSAASDSESEAPSVERLKGESRQRMWTWDERTLIEYLGT
ncbi:uncharacterized protein BP5553_07726 [Venustampulla echinocandica]|uniref:Uncharacterized protein n=1 Tax=Venustampulla echinocandica TaxID=2656787 RepID=A0A370THD2_9HELO|nr:uncharacterized protein BP5553_07726 [Venustampulla echinocandica]RDL34598.1 hypothetical protein BP5553_07726 [Venustampulla echinocandica]